MKKTTMSRKAIQFNKSWIVKFGLEVSTRDVATSQVTSVLCLFCKHCGRDDTDGDERKRKRTTNIKYYTSPWRSDHFNAHLRTQHRSKWELYQGLSAEEQTNFFVREEKAEAVAMRSFVQPQASMKASIIAKEKCKYIIDTEIIEQLIGELLFDTSAESNSCDDDIDRRKRYAMRAFVFNEDDKVYVATVNSVLKMNLIVKFLATGVSFRQASRIYHSVKEELGLGVLGCVSDVDVANQCRIVQSTCNT